MIFNINDKNQNTIFQPIQILLFQGNGSNLQHIQYFHNIPSLPSSFDLSLSDMGLYSPTLSSDSRRNSIFSNNSSIHTLHYDSLDSVSVSVKDSDISSSSSSSASASASASYKFSMNQLRSSNKVKDKALLFERLIQQESNDHQHQHHHYQHYNNNQPFFSSSSSFYDPIIYKNKSYSASDDLMSPNIKNISKHYLEQVERDRHLPVSSSPSSYNTHDHNRLPSRKILSSKLSQYQEHINKLNEEYIHV